MQRWGIIYRFLYRAVHSHRMSVSDITSYGPPYSYRPQLVSSSTGTHMICRSPYQFSFHITTPYAFEFAQGYHIIRAALERAMHNTI